MTASTIVRRGRDAYHVHIPSKRRAFAPGGTIGSNNGQEMRLMLDVMILDGTVIEHGSLAADLMKMNGIADTISANDIELACRNLAARSRLAPRKHELFGQEHRKAAKLSQRPPRLADIDSSRRAWLYRMRRAAV